MDELCTRFGELYGDLRGKVIIVDVPSWMGAKNIDRIDRLENQVLVIGHFTCVADIDKEHIHDAKNGAPLPLALLLG